MGKMATREMEQDELRLQNCNGSHEQPTMMDSSSQIPTPAPTPAPTLTPPPSKRLVFNRRYGFVFDQWQSPSEVALAGGRGMFCIIPLGKALLERASESINGTASCIINILQKPDELSPQILQATLTDNFHKFASSIKPESISSGLSGILSFQPTDGPSHLLTGSTQSKSDQ